MKTRNNHSKIHYYCSNNQNLRVRIAVTYISFLVMLPCQTELLLGLGLGDSWSSPHPTPPLLLCQQTHTNRPMREKPGPGNKYTAQLWPLF